jgi:hypothetical protein
MHIQRILAFLLAAGTAAVPAANAAAILQLYTERVRSNALGATEVPFGYYNSADPTLVSSNSTTSTPWNHDSHEDVKVSNSALYQSDTSVNKNKTLSTCPTSFCASAPDAEGHSGAVASGHADVDSLNVGAYSSATSYGASPGALSTSRATVTTMFRVTGGTSGLADGTPVDLNWLYHMEGSTTLGGHTYPDLSNSQASVTSNASIVRPGAGSEGEDVLASVLFHLDLSLADLIPSGSDPHTAIFSGRQTWSAYGNTGFDQSAFHSYDEEIAGEGQAISRMVSVDSKTGMLGLDYVPFQALVGEWVQLTLDLNLFSATGSGSYQFGPLKYGEAYNDYFNTLKSSFNFAGASQGLGLQLQFEQNAATAPAPEPGTLAAGFGLIVIAVLLRRRK